MVVENAFGRLKGRWKMHLVGSRDGGRWRCLLKRLDFKLDNVANVVAACVVLHNMCEIYGDPYLQEWTAEEHHDSSASELTSPIGTDASCVWDAIMQHLHSSQ